MSESIQWLQRNIAYSYISGDSIRDKRNCANAVCDSATALERALASSELSLRDVDQLVEVLCSRTFTKDQQLLQRASLARQMLLLELVRVHTHTWMYESALGKLERWMMHHEDDSVVRSYLATHLLGMPRSYVLGVLSGVCEYTRTHQAAS